MNGFTINTNNKAMKSVRQQREKTSSTHAEGQDNQQERKEPPKVLVLPYEERFFKFIRPLGRIYNLKFVAKPTNTIRKALMHVKDKTPLENKCNVIYEIPCSDGKTYIGETSRPLHQRIKEHKEALRNLKSQSSAIVEHITSSVNVAPMWNEVKVLATEDDWKKRRIKEALWIERSNTINRNHGLDDITQWWSTSSTHQ